jgi:hypothetical protein
METSPSAVSARSKKSIFRIGPIMDDIRKKVKRLLGCPDGFIHSVLAIKNI